MSLSRGELNPLGILKMRKLNFIPEHFSKITTYNFLDVKLLDHWITFNLNSRYAIKRQYVVDSENKMIEALEIGIEDPKEITLLTLGCPHLHNSN